MQAHPSCVRPDCRLYQCPSSGEWECSEHGGFDVCCGHPECPGNPASPNALRPELPGERGPAGDRGPDGVVIPEDPDGVIAMLRREAAEAEAAWANPQPKRWFRSRRTS